jgi:hypothetical protein
VVLRVVKSRQPLLQTSRLLYRLSKDGANDALFRCDVLCRHSTRRGLATWLPARPFPPSPPSTPVPLTALSCPLSYPRLLIPQPRGPAGAHRAHGAHHGGLGAGLGVARQHARGEGPRPRQPYLVRSKHVSGTAAHLINVPLATAPAAHVVTRVKHSYSLYLTPCINGPFMLTLSMSSSHLRYHGRVLCGSPSPLAAHSRWSTCAAA